MLRFFFPLYVMVVLCFVSGCEQTDKTQYQFELLRKDATGIDFENRLEQTNEFNVFSYMYFFNGAGVGAGDFDNDGRVDLYFASNQGANKLFLNIGNMKFEDITAKAGVDGAGGWSTGVSVVDINGDGLLDIYVNQVGDFKTLKGRNLLYINKGVDNGYPVFEEQAEQYGLDFVGFATQTAFFDYDQDGDLDIYQLNHSVHENGTFGERESFIGKVHPTSGDKLYRNENGSYQDVTEASGIHSLVIGYGLGITTGDINGDGLPDIYIGNDFHENDYLYLNQGNGTFNEVLNSQIMHTSRFSMGVDMADINNDGYNDIFSLDMQPYDPQILKSSLGEDDYSIFDFKLKYGYQVQFARNNLQLNNGDGTFSEIGMYSGVHATDWSWASLFMDFDHDGFKDLFVSNGIPRRMNDIDYVNFRENNEDHRWKTQANRANEEDLVLIDKIPQIKLPNKFLKNNGNLKFEDQEETIKNNTNTYSNGAAYADLDNDGDLDIVVNNIDDEPFIYKNLTIENASGNNHYLRLRFDGGGKNTYGIGTKTIVYKGKEKLVYENYPVRGFQSSMEPVSHIGIGDTLSVDSVLVIWPDGSYEKVTGFKYDGTHTVRYKNTLPKYHVRSEKEKEQVQFFDITKQTNINFQHEENPFVEFDRERLIPFMVSTEGPALAVGDINGDGTQDVFFGSSKRNESAIYLQQQDGTFIEKTPESIKKDNVFEDVDAVFVDIDNDGDLDLVVASGGNEYWGESEYLKQRIYINPGDGNFDQRITLEGAYLTASCVLPADINGDGLVDLFFGGRAVPNNYGKIPKSYLFLNKGNGQFTDVTLTYAKDLEEVGLVKNGEWTDVDLDGDQDLVLALEWGAVTLFLNDGQQLKKQAVSNHTGWWKFVSAQDFDGDGDIDILAGNAGENTRFNPTYDQPLSLYVQDFDGNGQVDQVLTYYLDGREIPFANYFELTKQMPFLRKNYLYAQDFAAASISELFGEDKIRTAELLQVNTLENAYFENTGDLKFEMKPLPSTLQFSTINAAAEVNVTEDSQDVILAGNFFNNNVEMGRYDASYGSLLSIDENGEFAIGKLGTLKIKGQVRKIMPVVIGGETAYIFARNNQSAVVVKPMKVNQLIVEK
ncbi:VCBS repeat-containing protein [Fulvivirga sp. 29W222]|uniref:VCBS repeat-containing protein n=1 Tax=Fulvivirga marina TaxID=2494733 RepID=A0A937G2Z1_9BACT|nr:VCBS repeat-containing protein [Fulvivirga marina]MBL6449078.1 VCBS repeat-containing protein [Fulvivirga marina]